MLKTTPKEHLKHNYNTLKNAETDELLRGLLLDKEPQDISDETLEKLEEKRKRDLEKRDKLDDLEEKLREEGKDYELLTQVPEEEFRANAAEYAENYWDDSDYDDIPYPAVELNCTNFTSQVIHEGGIEQKPGNGDPDEIRNWFCNTDIDYDYDNISMTWRHTDSWLAHWGEHPNLPYSLNEAEVFKKTTVEEAKYNWKEEIYDEFDKGSVFQLAHSNSEEPWHNMVIHDKYINWGWFAPLEHVLEYAQHEPGDYEQDLMDLLLRRGDNEVLYFFDFY